MQPFYASDHTREQRREARQLSTLMGLFQASCSMSAQGSSHHYCSPTRSPTMCPMNHVSDRTPQQHLPPALGGTRGPTRAGVLGSINWCLGSSCGMLMDFVLSGITVFSSVQRKQKCPPPRTIVKILGGLVSDHPWGLEVSSMWLPHILPSVT